jgi:hypothetical protein
LLCFHIVSRMQALEARTRKPGREEYPDQPGAWLTPCRFSIVLGLLIFASFPQVLLGLQTFVVRDYGFFAYPLAHFQREAFWRGELPLWNPYNNCGVPFLAQWNTMPLYPPALIYLLLPLKWSLSFFCLLHLFWAGLGMYFLTHRWTGLRLAAAVGGVLFAFNGLSLNFLMWPSHIATFSWMPWVVLCVERAWREGGRKIFLAIACGALQMLAGGPETILLTWLLLSAVWLKQLVEGFLSRRGTARGIPVPPETTLHENGGAVDSPVRLTQSLLWRFPLIVMLVAAVAAAQLLPFMDLAGHSQREQGYADTRWSMPTWGWANFLVPMVFGQVWSMGVFFQHGQAWTSSYYLGVGALLLAILAAWTVRQWRVWLLASGAVLALLLAMGDQSFVYRAVRHFLPQLSMMTYPVKFVIFITFAAPVLASFAIARLQNLNSQEARGFRRKVLTLGILMLGLIIAILIWAHHSPFPADDYSATLGNGIGRAFLLLLTTAVLLALQQCFCRTGKHGDEDKQGAEPVSTSANTSSPRTFDRIEPFLPFVLLVLLWLDVWTHEPTQNPTVPHFIYAPGLARAKLAMQPQPELFQSRAMLTPEAALKFRQFVVSSPANNFLVKRLGYFADCNLLDGVPKVDGFFSIFPRESGELLSVLYGTTNASLSHLADFMSVSQISTPGEFLKWTPRTNFMPLVTGGQRPFYFDDAGMLSAIFSTNLDARRIVCLLKEAHPSVSVTNETAVRVISSRIQNERVDLEVEAAAPSLMVFSQTFYHPWHAFIDNSSTPLFRANYAFQAVQVPGGRHHVRLIYQDRAFHLGAMISGVALVVCLLGWLFRARPQNQL